MIIGLKRVRVKKTLFPVYTVVLEWGLAAVELGNTDVRNKSVLKNSLWLIKKVNGH